MYYEQGITNIFNKMLLGMIFTTILSWLVFCFGICIAFFIFKSKKKDFLKITFALIWLVLGVIYYFEGIAAMFARREMFELTGKMFWVMGFLTYVIQFPAVLYIFYKTFKCKWFSYLVTGIYFIGAIPYYYIFFNTNMVQQEITYFILTFHLDSSVQFYFSFGFLPIFILGIYELIKSVIHLLKNRKWEKLHNFLQMAALIMATVSAYLDQVGLLMGWHVAFSRIILVTATLIAFGTVYYDESRLDEESVTLSHKDG